MIFALNQSNPDGVFFFCFTSMCPMGCVFPTFCQNCKNLILNHKLTSKLVSKWSCIFSGNFCGLPGLAWLAPGLAWLGLGVGLA
jgi:hypothetical protein